MSVPAHQLSSEIEEAAEKFLKTISNELHKYYIYERRVSQYSVRLIELLDIAQAIKVIYCSFLELLKNYFQLFERKNQEMMTFIKVFEIFNLTHVEGREFIDKSC